MDQSHLEDTIAQDLKQAMLAQDTLRVSVLRSLKSAFTYAKVAPGAALDDDGKLDDQTALVIIAKEAKKRQESADSFKQVNQTERVEAELAEKAIIDSYLPAQLSESDLVELIASEIAKLNEVSPKLMGQVIAAVKAQAGPATDGAVIAKLVKEKLAG